MQTPDLPEEKLARSDDPTLIVDVTAPSSNVARNLGETTEHYTTHADQTQEAMARMVGRVLNNHFEIIAAVAHGGMSYVFKAEGSGFEENRRSQNAAATPLAAGEQHPPPEARGDGNEYA